jgi:hypothetical protein
MRRLRLGFLLLLVAGMGLDGCIQQTGTPDPSSPISPQATITDDATADSQTRAPSQEPTHTQGPERTPTNTSTPPPNDFACASPPANSLMETVCNVRDGLGSGNLTTLQDFIIEPFRMGYWESEWVLMSADEAMASVAGFLPDDPSILEFSLRRDAYPQLQGNRPEDLMSFDYDVALVVFCTGWSSNQAGEALLFFVSTEAGFAWQGLVISPGGSFDH